MEKPYEIDEAFYALVGRMAVAWSMIEIPLDIVCGILFARTDGSRKYNNEIPRSFERKVTFASKCFNNIPELKEFQFQAKWVLEKATSLAIERHRLVHGIVDNFTPVPEGRVIFRKIIYEKDRQFIETRVTTFDEIKAATQEATETGMHMGTLASVLAQHYRIVLPEQ
jgi:hypothetical protein